MSERLPYEQELAAQLQDLPLPDENMAWADMKRRLEEDEDRRVLPPWWRGCGLWGLLLLFLALGGWWLYKKTGSSKQAPQSVSRDTLEGNNPVRRTVAYSSGDTSVNQPPENKPASDTASTGDSIKTTGTNKTAEKKKEESRFSNPSLKPAAKDKIGNKKYTGGLTAKRIAIAKTGNAQTAKDRKKKEPATGEDKELVSVEPKDTVSTASKDPGPGITGERKTIPANKKDTTVTAKLSSDSVQKKDIAKIAVPKQDTVQQLSKKEKTDSSKSKTAVYFFSTGLAEQQLMPIDSQKAVPYGSSGRKGTLLDYIPSIYLRYNKKGKWFVQGEFKYGAPQYHREFKYSEVVKTELSPGGTPLRRITTSKNLQKTYYHQVPLSFNYYVLPNLSVGGGIVWNKFVSAIYEENVHIFNIDLQLDSTEVPQIRRTTPRNRGEFAGSYFMGLGEVQYQWHRFSLGARYSFGLQPYIRYTLPGQPERRERTNSLLLFLRFELWRSKKGR